MAEKIAQTNGTATAAKIEALEAQVAALAEKVAFLEALPEAREARKRVEFEARVRQQAEWKQQEAERDAGRVRAALQTGNVLIGAFKWVCADGSLVEGDPYVERQRLSEPTDEGQRLRRQRHYHQARAERVEAVFNQLQQALLDQPHYAYQPKGWREEWGPFDGSAGVSMLEKLQALAGAERAALAAIEAAISGLPDEVAKRRRAEEQARVEHERFLRREQGRQAVQAVTLED